MTENNSEYFIQNDQQSESTDEPAERTDSFAALMRKSTRREHSINNVLVTAKFCFTLTNREVWAEGLLVFYEVFKYLENAIDRQHDKMLGKFKLEDVNITDCFERDLTQLYGKEWKDNYKPRECVQNYIEHLKNLEATDSDLLIPFVYLMFMGLFSGGQLLKKWSKPFSIGNILSIYKDENKTPIYSVTDFEQDRVTSLKQIIRNSMDQIGRSINDEKKQKLLEEGNNVFKMNTELIKSVKSSKNLLMRKTMKVFYNVGFIIILGIFLNYIFNSSTHKKA